jgi:class 3 adenylate cyclase/tetratricopeptide (TPR) repeat protein
MRCSHCGQENPPGSRFCNTCGARQEQATPDTSPQAYTPPHLSEKILTSRAALEGERKQVTVLFGDLKSSMELLADRDPEEARHLLDAVLERMMDAVHRYEGTVNQVMGDGIMALFGAPLAHEDHAIRACYAALRMQETVSRYAEELQRTEGLGVRIRVGLNSGEVVVRSIGSDLRMDYTAVGQTTHLAARMEQMAPAGSILITPSTLRLAESAITVRQLGLQPIKGLEDPLAVYELMGAVATRSLLKPAGAQRRGRFINRRDQFDRLAGLLADAHEGHGQVAAVTAEPGLGKTRLVYEFLQSSLTRDWRVLESTSHSYEKSTAWGPIVELLRQYFALDPRDAPEAIAAKVSDTLRTLAPELGDLLAPLLALLDAVPENHPWHALDAQERRRRVLDALTRLLLTETTRQPLLMVFENLQWADLETRALLESLLERVPTARLMLLLDYRPEFAHDWRSRSAFTEVPVPPLPPEAAHALLETMLGADRGLAPLKALLVERGQGNPFFLEEIVRTLLEAKALVPEHGTYRLTSDLATLEVPATVQAVLAARIDRLPADKKLLLQSAAVIGMDVPFALLEAVTELPVETLQGALGHLQAAGFLAETRLYPDHEYRFRNALTRDVAYASLLREHRRALHARIVEAIEILYGERLSSWIEPLAHHASRGEVWPKAAIYNRQAASRAAAHAANVEAVRAYQAALHALGHLPQSRETSERAVDLRLDLRPPLLQLGRLDEVLGVSLEAERIARELGDEVRLARVYTYLVNHHYLKGETQTAIEYGERCLEVGRATGDRALEGHARQYMGQSHHLRGDYATAERVLRENLAGLDLDRGGTPYLASCGWLSWSLAERGEFEAAEACLDSAIRAAADSPHAYSQAIAWTFAGLVAIRSGDLGRAVLPLARSLELSQRKHLTLWQPIPSSLLGLALVRMGHLPAGLRLLEAGVARSRELGIRAYLAAWLLNLAEGYLASGQHARAATTVREALALAQADGERGHEAYCHQLLGDLAARGARPKLDEAQREYETALALAEGLGLRPLTATVHRGLHALHALRGGRAAAEPGLRPGPESPEAQMTGPRHLFVVARSNTDLHEFLAQELAGTEGLEVILDRRQGAAADPSGAPSERRRARPQDDLRDWELAVATRGRG